MKGCLGNAPKNDSKRDESRLHLQATVKAPVSVHPLEAEKVSAIGAGHL